MKLITIKFILTLTLVFGVMAWSQEVQATSFTGYVLTSTNAPVAGVWLKVHYEWLTDNYIYVQTNTNGLFVVDTNDSGSGTADIDLNPDTPSVPRKNGCPFCYVSDGNYGLNFIMPYNWSGTVVVPTWTGYFNLGSSGSAEYPIRLYRTRSISGNVFIDTNGNGLKNGDETGYNSQGAIILGIIDTLPAAGTTTDSEGHYEMRENNQISVSGGINDVPTLLNEGAHTLTFTVPIGYKLNLSSTPIKCNPSTSCSTIICSNINCSSGSVISVPLNLISDTIIDFGLQLNN